MKTQVNLMMVYNYHQGYHHREPNPFSLSGEYRNYEAEIDLSGTSMSGSLGSLGLPSLVKLGEIDPRTEFGTTYAFTQVLHLVNWKQHSKRLYNHLLQVQE